MCNDHVCEMESRIMKMTNHGRLAEDMTISSAENDDDGSYRAFLTLGLDRIDNRLDSIFVMLVSMDGWTKLSF